MKTKIKIQPFNRYYFLEKVEPAETVKTAFYTPDNAINGNYEFYKIYSTPNDATLPLKQGDQVVVMQSMIETAKILQDVFFCPESAIICKA